MKVDAQLRVSVKGMPDMNILGSMPSSTSTKYSVDLTDFKKLLRMILGQLIGFAITAGLKYLDAKSFTFQGVDYTMPAMIAVNSVVELIRRFCVDNDVSLTPVSPQAPPPGVHPSAAAAAVALLLLPVLLQAQPSAPGGLVYQALLQNGVNYISPLAGQAIVNQKAGLNWKTLGSQILVDGSLGVLSGGLSGVINIGTTAETGLAAFHLFADKKIAPILALAGSHPDSIPPVLQVSQAMSPTTTGCAEASIYAVFNPKLPPKIPSATINGVVVSFSAQGAAVLRNASGQLIRSFQIIDVLACLPQSTSVTPPVVPALQGKAARQEITDAPGMIPRLWAVDTDRPEETGLAAIRGGWRKTVEVASR